MTSSYGNPLEDLRKANEELYFRKKNAELAAQLKMRSDLKAQGITDSHLIDELLAAGFNEDSLQALFLVPLVEVAWADGEVQAEERKEILKTLTHAGAKETSEAYSLISRWLDSKPTDEKFLRAKTLFSSLIDELKKEGKNDTKWILQGAKRVADAAGGMLFGIGIGSKVSSAEEEVIKRTAQQIS